MSDVTEAPYGAGSHAPLADDAMPDGYPVKGNAESMKFHQPGGRWYDNTIAEVWFADAAAAAAAGFEEAGGGAKSAAAAPAEEVAEEAAPAEEAPAEAEPVEEAPVAAAPAAATAASTAGTVGSSSTEANKAEDSTAEDGVRENPRKVREGIVVSAGMNKTAVIESVDRVRHRRYAKTVQRSTKLFAHDEENDANVGDLVRIQETRPLSKKKRWRLVEIIERAR